MEEWARLIEAISGLVSGIAWPVAITLSVWMIIRRHREAVDRFIDRVKVVSYPGGHIDLTEIEAQEAHVEELTKQVSSPESDEERRREVATRLAEEATKLGRLRQDVDWLRSLDEGKPYPVRFRSVTPGGKVQESTAYFYPIPSTVDPHTKGLIRRLLEQLTKRAKHDKDDEGSPPVDTKK
ncbi:hypothetical protein SAMN04489764_4260 [Thermostaphylospora chromogena]|uniref:Uncharacterized protein n=2 Tax=Thermostaphylospora chromogena TaxID=35622 RepID=A0A1H1HBZ9_9ACTN|nr:hypothetical protein SAMN04489764_4260 [Thermostaphylospora chromogena]